MHLQVYIDTNVFLDLVASQAVISESAKKFLALCENGGLRLHLPEQTEKEFLANREDVIARTLQDIRKSKELGGLPPIIRTHSKHPEISKLRREMSDALDSVEHWYAEAAKTHSLAGDILFEGLQKVSLRIPTTPEIIAKARHRAELHLAPGKGEDLGDRIVWESLLQSGGFFEDLYLITADQKDYSSPVDKNSIRKVLKDEWSNVNCGEVFLSKSIDDFFNSVSETNNFLRASEVGRAIWLFGSQSDEAQIDKACDILERNIAQISLVQAKMISRNACEYCRKVFVTSTKFDDVMAKFFRLYSKHLSDEESALLSSNLVGVMREEYNWKAANLN